VLHRAFDQWQRYSGYIAQVKAVKRHAVLPCQLLSSMMLDLKLPFYMWCVEACMLLHRQCAFLLGTVPDTSTTSQRIISSVK